MHPLRPLSRLPTVVAMIGTLAIAAAALAAEGDPEARLAQARQQWRSGDTSGARSVVVALLEEVGLQRWPPSPWRAAARLELGTMAWQSGADIEAAGHFLHIMEEEPTSQWTAAARLGLARTLIASGDSLAAAKLLERVATDPEAAGVATEAADHLALLHRLAFLPATGATPWTHCDPFPVLPDEVGKLVGIDVAGDRQAVVMGRQGVLQYSATHHQVTPLDPAAAGRPFHDSQGATFLVVGDGLLPVGGGGKRSFRDPGASREQTLDNLLAGGRDAFGQWLLLDSRSDRALLFAADGSYLQTLGEAGNVEATDVSQDLRGRLYVLDRRGNRVLRMEPESNRLTTVVADDWRRPEALAIDAQENLYVLDRGQRQVIVYSPHGDTLTRLGPLLANGCELRSPEDLAVDARGRIFIADSRTRGILVLE